MGRWVIKKVLANWGGKEVKLVPTKIYRQEDTLE